jgi:hypothetical protein
MAIAQSDLIAAAKGVAQDASRASLLIDDDSYVRAVAMAVEQFDLDRPNRRVVHHTVDATGFRFPLSGDDALSELTGLDAWVDGRSALLEVWHPYDVTVQGQMPLDPRDWRVVDDPTGAVLELLATQPSSGILRLEFTSPHVVGATAAETSVKAGDVSALTVLTGAQILTLYAVRAVQNTGNTGLPADVVDRRTQSDQARSAAKELLARYRLMVGQRVDPDDGPPTSAVGEMDVQIGGLIGPLWPVLARR